MVASTSKYLDPTTALEHLKTYTRKDGLSLAELMDSQVNGGLTCTSLYLSLLSLDFSRSSLERRLIFFSHPSNRQ